MKLAAGALSMTLEGMALRWLRWNEVEILRGVAFVVRDALWNTYPLSAERVSYDEVPDRIEMHLRAVVAAPRLVCELHIALHAAGLKLEGRASAGEDFPTNRTGFVVLHGEQCAGTPVTVEHTDGTTKYGQFPPLVSPHQPFLNLRAVTHAPVPGVAVRVGLDGETFEMEDHRNWSDAGFKTYSRPLAHPRPFVIAAGATLTQAVSVELAPARPPRIAVGAPALQWQELPADAALLVVETATGADLDGFARLLATSGRPGAVLLSGNGPRRAAIAAIAAAGMFEALLMANATVDDVAFARVALPHTKIGAGSDHHFAELNRNPLPPNVDFVFWGLSATVHAVDDASVLETLRAVPDQARAARTLLPGVPLWIGPVGMGARWMADPRDATPFGSAFLRSQLEVCGEAGIDTVIVPARRASSSPTST